jgi:1-acyl-sn-glycerol-3-phosphate acyltransferase
MEKTKMHVPILGDAIPRRGNLISQSLGKFMLILFGWRIEGTIPNRAKFIIVVAPHTSNWDFFFGVMAMFAIGFKAHWLGKDTLFTWPFGALMRWLGGIPINRRIRLGAVDQAIVQFASHDQFIMGIAPEGTRKKVERWKTGFYYIAQGAGVPMVLVFFDYSRKVIGIGPVISTTGNISADMNKIQAFYAGIAGKYAY